MKKKVLLMGASGSGKTSMRSLIFSNNPASLTARLGATIDVEQNHVRFLGDLILNLWDCGGQDAFMDSYLSTQQSTIFQHVGVMIYVFEVQSRNMRKDLEYYRDCLAALRRYSPDAAVFLLVHKMDLVNEPRGQTLDRKTAELQQASDGMGVTVFGTSIYDESLYKAWSRIVHTLIPNVAVLSKHLTTLAHACNATEVILFERTTFLVIATSSPPPSPASIPLPVTPLFSTPSSMHSNGLLTPTSTSHTRSNARYTPDDSDPHKLAPTRYERTSELIKAFKHACSRVREDFRSLEMELAEFTAVLDELTKNTYVLIVVHDPTIETAALKMNIRLARKKFEELQGDSLVS
ncbi:GTP-binding protein [Sparassis crispa]|uniref:GTP-binding protein n=1 Tax=Sparassis crispa TaxID=139825 RepID=A0A401GHV5_9APHY|nr:GTP-binding protein [Sparassis crispa]GBE81738.1 GTP-binding protein [Sparassis crispa]